MSLEKNQQIARDLVNQREDKARLKEEGQRAITPREIKQIKPNFFILHRDIFNSSVCYDAVIFRLYVLMISLANWENRGVIMGGNRVFVNRGQFITSLSNIRDIYNKKMKKSQCLSNKQIRGRIDVLKRADKINTKGHSTYTLITVLNYDFWQDQRQGINRIKGQGKGQTEGKPRATTNNNNNYNNKKIKNKKRLTVEDLKSSVVDFDRVLGNYYSIKRISLEGKMLGGQFKEDKKAFIQDLALIVKLKDYKYKQIMTNLSKNGRLSLPNVAMACLKRNKPNLNEILNMPD